MGLLLPLSALPAPLPPIKTIFLIVMENHSWSAIYGSSSAPYINNTLLPMASHCEGYQTLAVHPSLPNYLWLEAGTNFGILDDNPPANHNQHTTNHLSTLLNRAGISWKAYQENISGSSIPLTDSPPYAVRHNPFAYFDDVTGTNNPYFAYGMAHIRPYSEFGPALTGNTIARYNFISPNVCNDGHDSCAPSYDPVRQIDTWLAAQVPLILNSTAYKEGGVLFITWDENSGADTRIGMIVLSPFARGGGYSNAINYSHGSTLRTIQEIFGVGPLLGAAAASTDLSDLFLPLADLTIARLAGSAIRLTATGVIPGRTNIIQASTNLSTWITISTNSGPTSTFAITNNMVAGLSQRFYRVVELP